MIIAEAIINGKQIPTPHGRLIDADKFKADHSMKNDCEWIDNAETVIEAEE